MFLVAQWNKEHHYGLNRGIIMDNKPCNYFEVLNSINCNEHVEKKGGFSYLSWTYAVAELRKRHPEATWEVSKYNGLPFLETPLGYFVEVTVTVNGIPMTQIHPVLDNRNQVIKQPNAFQINTSIQRAIVKAIALHGLGLYIYAGEDLPTDIAPVPTPAKEANPFAEMAAGKVVPVSDSEIKEIFGADVIEYSDPCDKEQQKKMNVAAKERGYNAETIKDLYAEISYMIGYKIQKFADVSRKDVTKILDYLGKAS